MKKTFQVLTVTAATCLGIIPEIASAAEVSLNEVTLEEDGSTSVVVERQQGPYVGAWLGAAAGGRASVGGELQGAELQDSTGFAAGLKLGYFYRTPYFIRPALELELAYLNTPFSVSGNVASNGASRAKFTGASDLQAMVGTLNFILALDLGSLRDQVGDFVAGLHPYIGAGAGFSYTEVGSFDGKLKGTDGEKSRRLKVDGGSKIDFAYQLTGGLEIDLDEDFSIFGEFKHISLGGTGNGSVSEYERELWVFGCKLAY